jgi:hypothetical protein
MVLSVVVPKVPKVWRGDGARSSSEQGWKMGCQTLV